MGTSSSPHLPARLPGFSAGRPRARARRGDPRPGARRECRDVQRRHHRAIADLAVRYGVSRDEAEAWKADLLARAGGRPVLLQPDRYLFARPARRAAGRRRLGRAARRPRPVVTRSAARQPATVTTLWRRAGDLGPVEPASASTSVVCSPRRGAGRRIEGGVADAPNGVASIRTRPSWGAYVGLGDLGQEPEVADLRIAEHLVELVDRPGRDRRRLEPCHPLRRGPRGERRLHPAPHLVVVGQAIGVPGEARLRAEDLVFQHAAEAVPLLGVHQDDVEVAVGRPEGLGRRQVGVAVAHALRALA